ncbi:MAG: class I SAM-dependent methyltransferase [Roseiarcus sp.]
MIAEPGPVVIGPSAYVAWRETSLGAITETLELRTMLDLMGEVKGAGVLDVGCGDGLLACSEAKRGAQATGVDANPAMLAAARHRAEEGVVAAAFLERRAERLPFPNDAFDVVCAVTVLCFVEEAGAALHEMARVLRPGGRLVVGELGRWSLWAEMRRVRGWLGAKTWRAARFRGAAELRVLVAEAGFTVASALGAIFYPPSAILARLMAPIDFHLGRRTTFGAAFVALAATKAQASMDRA